MKDFNDISYDANFSTPATEKQNVKVLKQNIKQDFILEKLKNDFNDEISNNANNITSQKKQTFVSKFTLEFDENESDYEEKDENNNKKDHRHNIFKQMLFNINLCK